MFTHDFIIKNKALELYKLNYPCRRLFAIGSFTPELIETERFLRNNMPLQEGNYSDYRHVCKSILGISHGTEAFGTRLTFLAPLFMGISKVNFEQNQLRVDLICYPEDELDKTRVVVHNTLEPNDKKVLRDFVKVETGTYSQTIEQDPGNLWIRLYHNDQLIDEVVEG